jgi:hypothetical protein
MEVILSEDEAKELWMLLCRLSNSAFTPEEARNVDREQAGEWAAEIHMRRERT